MLEQRDNVGESFMERRHVEIGPLRVAGMQAVQERMGRLVRDDVMRDDVENHRAAHYRAAAVGGREIAEQERNLLGIVVGVRIPERMRIDPEPRHVAVIGQGASVLRTTTGPERLAAERSLEALDRPHRNRIGHLLMELRTGFRG